MSFRERLIAALFAIVAVLAGSTSIAEIKQAPGDLLAGEVMAIAYSGFREGQHPDRGDGAKNPSTAEILEDLEILVAHDFNLIRLYDSGENSLATLELIRQHDLPIKVLLGMWLEAEFSNHEGCAWCDESTLRSNSVTSLLPLTLATRPWLAGMTTWFLWRT